MKTIRFLLFILLCAVVQGAWAQEQEVEFVHRSWDGTKVVRKTEKTKAKRLNDINAGGKSVELSGNYYVTGTHDTNGVIYISARRTTSLSPSRSVTSEHHTPLAVCMTAMVTPSTSAASQAK